MQHLAPSLMKTIVESKQWKEFLTRLKNEMAACSQEVAEDFKRESVSDKFASSNEKQNGLGSTWNQSNFIMMHPDQLDHLAEALHLSQSQDKIAALNSLLSSQLSDVVSSQQWPTIKKGLRRCCGDSDSR